MTQPLDPFLNPVMCCMVCETYFMVAKVVAGEDGPELVCPHPLCEASEYDCGPLLEFEVGEMFHQIIDQNFTPERTMNLTIIARHGMGAVNGLTRLL